MMSLYCTSTVSGRGYLTRAEAPGRQIPYSMFIWYKPSVHPSTQPFLVRIGKTTSPTGYFAVNYQATGDKLLFGRRNIGASLVDVMGETPTVGDWNSVGFVAYATNHHALFQNGLKVGEDTNTSVNNNSAGWNLWEVASRYFLGKVAKVALWSYGLVAADFEALDAGVSPLLVRPGYLQAYCPLLNSGIDVSGNEKNLSLTSETGVSWDEADNPYEMVDVHIESLPITGRGSLIIIPRSDLPFIPVRPESPVTESLQFLTTVIPKDTMHEQRIAVRSIPRRIFDTIVVDRRDIVESVLYGRQAEDFAMPMWHEVTRLTSPVAPGATALPVQETAYRSFEDGKKGLIYVDGGRHEFVSIASVGPTELVLSSSIAQGFPAGAEVFPVCGAHIDNVVSVSRRRFGPPSYRIRYRVIDDTMDWADTAAWDTFNGKVILDDENYVDGDSINESRNQRIVVVDSVSGIVKQATPWPSNRPGGRKGFVTHTPKELWELRQLLYALRGRQVSFYMPTFAEDIVPVEPLMETDNSMTIHMCKYADYVKEGDQKKNIRVVLNDGTILHRTITNHESVSADVEIIAVDVAWPYDIALEDIHHVDYVELVRSDSDEISITHYTARGGATCEIPLIGVPYPTSVV